uniref:Aspartate aminotransferase n=1 Tax=Colletotrichum fructicola (strain Nara gc5) TaxID=1213859 RepID=L2G3C4_COLFN
MLSTARIATRQAAVRRAAALPVMAARAGSTWANVPQGPPAILGITEAFKADTFEQKINLGVGAYRDDQGKPYVLPSVRAAEEKVVAAKLNKEYAGITGVPEFTKAAANIYIPTPSWANHGAVFTDSGLAVHKYRYYDQKTIGLDFAGMLADIKAAPKNSIFLFHACAHNPTGVDPTPEQWREISDAVKAAGHYSFFDMAYQGFASGNTDTDAFAVRHFVKEGHNIALAQSFAKNMGSASAPSPSSPRTPTSASASTPRSRSSSAPSTPTPPSTAPASPPPSSTINKQWLCEVKGMADRIITMRALLKDNLEKLGSAHDWSHITSQIGMFAYTGLTPQQMDALAKDHSVYATKDGRISVAGITSGNVGRLAEAIYKVKG